MCDLFSLVFLFPIRNNNNNILKKNIAMFISIFLLSSLSLLLMWPSNYNSILSTVCHMILLRTILFYWNISLYILSFQKEKKK